MKKVLVGSVAVLFIITATYMLFKNDLNKTASVNEIENSLIKSMEETKTDKKKLEQFLTKSSKN